MSQLDVLKLYLGTQQQLMKRVGIIVLLFLGIAGLCVYGINGSRVWFALGILSLFMYIDSNIDFRMKEG